MGTTGKEEACPMPGGSSVIQLQPCQAAVLSDQPIKEQQMFPSVVQLPE